MAYECTAVGDGLTYWTGTAFNCSSSNDEVVLFHCRFLSAGGTNGTCNNGAILGRSLTVDGNNYTSQLIITVTPNVGGETVDYLHDDGRMSTLLLSLVIPATGLSLV